LSTIPSISTKRTITSQHNSLNIAYNVGNPGSGLGQVWLGSICLYEPNPSS